MADMIRMIAPSILAADFGRLGEEIDMVNQSSADWIHCDIMDGVFVPNISFGLPVMEFLKRRARKPLDVHLMIVHPDKFIRRFHEAGAAVLTVHYEACTHLNRVADEIKSLGMKAGVSINPHTPVLLLENIIPYIDMVLVMSVNPGYGGQTFIPGSFSKIRKLRKMADELNPALLIQVDGGVDTKNAAELYEAGANILVSGTTIFKADDPMAVMSKMKQA